MSILLETTIGDLVIDLDVDGSPALCKNILKLTKARYFTQNLVYNIHPNRFFQLGDPRGDGKGGACIYGVLDAYETARNTGTEPDVFRSKRRFLRSDMGRGLTREECRQKGRVVATEISGIADTIGSQLLFTVAEGVDNSLDGFGNYKTNNTTGNNESITIDQSTPQIFRSVGTVVEDDNDVLSHIKKVSEEVNTNVGVILNGVGQQNSYGYSYGYRYGYGYNYKYSYNYGYGYGYNEESS